MLSLDEIIKSNLKPKEKLNWLAEEISRDKSLIPSVIEYFDKGKDSEKGLCVEALEAVSQTKPEIVLPHLAFILDQINHKAPRVKWEASRIIANLAKSYPDMISEAIPLLLKNTTDLGTVVRWSTALALTEIVKFNAEARNEWLPRLKEIEDKEENNGVKNVYKKAFKSLAKNLNR